MTENKEEYITLEQLVKLKNLSKLQKQSLDNFIDFLGIESINHETNAECCKFFADLYSNGIDAKECNDIFEKNKGIWYQIIEPLKNYPIFILKICGSTNANNEEKEKDIKDKDNIKSLLLNGHYDVVPAYKEKWNTDPFIPSITKDGKIIARGTQDMKSICMQYYESLKILIDGNWKPERNVYVTLVPDEEKGGIRGMKKFIDDGYFDKLDIGIGLDEGIGSNDDNYTLFYGERAPWWLSIKANGPAGHGSKLIKNTAMEKLIKSINHFLAFREEQVKILEHEGCKHLGDVVTINLTMLKGGVTDDGGKTYSINCIPNTAEACFDIRIPPSIDLKEFEDKIKGWTHGEDITYSFINKMDKHNISSIDPKKNEHYAKLTKTFKHLDMKIKPSIYPAGTDSRFIRALGVPCFGFSPIIYTKNLLHDYNEYLGYSTFLDGIAIYSEIIKELSTV